MLALKIIAWLRPDVRIRIRRSVIRIQVKEARIRAIIRIRRHQRPTPAYNRKKNYICSAARFSASGGFALRGPCYGMKQGRDPKYAVAFDGALSVYRKKRPAVAP